MCFGQMGNASIERFSSGPEALNALAEQGEGIELLVTDRDMPGMGGLEVAIRIREWAPEMKVVLMTSNHAELCVHTLQRAGVIAVLPKPFSLQRLETLVREVSNEERLSALPLELVRARAA
jgi:CheY-like chemotaxis protein